MKKFKEYNNERFKRRAIELFHNDSPFKPKTVKDKKKYTRKVKNRKNEDVS